MMELAIPKYCYSMNIGDANSFLVVAFPHNHIVRFVLTERAFYFSYLGIGNILLKQQEYFTFSSFLPSILIYPVSNKAEKQMVIKSIHMLSIPLQLHDQNIVYESG